MKTYLARRHSERMQIKITERHPLYGRAFSAARAAIDGGNERWLADPKELAAEREYEVVQFDDDRWGVTFRECMVGHECGSREAAIDWRDELIMRELDRAERT